MKATLTLTLPRRLRRSLPWWDHPVILVIIVIVLVKYDLPAALIL